MKDHIIGEDYELWDIVTDGPLATLKKNAEGVDVPKTRADCIAEDLRKFVLVGTVDGVETTESGKFGGKNKNRKEKESEGVRGTVRGVKKGVAESSPTSVSLTKETSAMENKKRKVASSIPVETPPTRGRATKSQKKQSKAELEKTLEESKRKVASKGKKKVVKPVEAVEINEMDLVLRDEDETEEVEVVTPKSKKVKTSTKKSVSKIKSAEPSTLAKRTRKTPQGLGGGRDVNATGEVTVARLKGHGLSDRWKARTEIVEFMANCEIKNSRVASVVKGGDIELS
ncbi:uncharacterized protein [Nicotiana sylvestris]|uniref:uncharacterized protein n=1 Tax=Nicotiana sylvestris TaxID=4096 RepID=UPI00388C7953